MNKINYLVVLVSLSGLFALPASADFFENRDLVTYSDMGSDPGDTQVKFGGCEDGDACYTYADDDYHKIMWVIGDLNVLQGTYYLPLADGHDHGRLKLKYDYKLASEDAHDNSTDYGRIRIKDIDTDEILYEKILLPEDADDWQTEIAMLSGSDATKNLQLVFESNNDDSGLTQLYIRNWSLRHKSEAAITGAITYQVNGETRYAANALVALQNKARTETFGYATTNDQGKYTFFPVSANQRYVVTATLDGYNGLKRLHRKVKYGNQYTVNFRLTEI